MQTSKAAACCYGYFYLKPEGLTSRGNAGEREYQRQREERERGVRQEEKVGKNTTDINVTIFEEEPGSAIGHIVQNII